MSKWVLGGLAVVIGLGAYNMYMTWKTINNEFQKQFNQPVQ